MKIYKRQKKIVSFIITLLLFFTIELCLTKDTSFADIFNVYNDRGIPHESQLWLWNGGGGSSREVQDEESPERVSYFETISRNWAGWGIFFDIEDGGEPYTMDLSEYAEGHLKFFVRTPVDLKIEIKKTGPNGRVRREYISNHGWNEEDVWQEISIPIEEFGANLDEIYSPFMVTGERAGTFDIDYIRWTAPIGEYEPTLVEIDGREILVDGDVFTVKGVAGEFTPIGEYGPGYDWSLNPEDYSIDIPLIRDLGANTIRTYDERPTQKEALDAFYEQGIFVIMGFTVEALYGGEIVDFENQTVRENIRRCFLDMVSHWKDHPAILMWCIGNEVNSILESHDVDPNHWYSLVDECAEASHELEGEAFHPVTTANADQGEWDIGDPDMNADDDSVQHLDLWSLQLYRGESFGDTFFDYGELTAKPLLMTEFGCDAYDGRRHQEDQSMQAECLEAQWLEIGENLSSIDPDNVCAGGVIFSWRDAWYKSRHGNFSHHGTQADWRNEAYIDPNMNEEWWGIVAISENPEERILREAYDTISGIWNPFIDIPLRRGWNIISFNVEREDMSMINILDPLIGREELIIIKDETGRFISPEHGFDNIGDMDIREGYQIKVTQNTNLIVRGEPVERAVEIPLRRGWNIMGYPCQIAQSVRGERGVLQPLLDDGVVELVKDELGHFISPRWNFWGFNTFQPGKGYQIKVTEDTVLEIDRPR